MDSNACLLKLSTARLNVCFDIIVCKEKSRIAYLAGSLAEMLNCCKIQRQTFTQCTNPAPVRFQFTKLVAAPTASKASQSIKYSGLLPPSMATISPACTPKSSISQFATLVKVSKNCLYDHVFPSKMRKGWSGCFWTWSSKT